MVTQSSKQSQNQIIHKKTKSQSVTVIPPYIATTIKPQLYPTPSLSTEHAHRGCTTWLTE